MSRRREAARPAAIAAALWGVAFGAVALWSAAAGGGPVALAALLLAAALAPALGLLLLRETLARLTALEDAVAALRGPLDHGAAGGPQGGAMSRSDPVLARLAAIESALRDTRAGVAALGALSGATPPDAARRTAPPAPGPVTEDAPSLPFAAESAPPAPSAPITWGDVTRALDFPRDDNDAAGFDAVSAALRDPQFAALLQASEDVLSILAAAGLHMEDLRPDPAPLSVWRAYADGARGAEVEAIGGVRDPQALAQARAMLRADGVFRDAALVLAQRWGRLIRRMARELGEDPALLQAADSRTGRAFMLLARAMGAFD